MDILYIFGITILVMCAGGAYSAIEEKKTDKELQQRILLRKLQNFQETKPVTWNEVLADVLVNKIIIFSFTGQDKENALKKEDPVSTENTIVTNFFSKVLYVYKKFIYDAYLWKRKIVDDEKVHLDSTEPNSVNIIPKKIPEDVIKPTEVIFPEGPKSEVELIEPKYHGKFALEDTTLNPVIGTADASHRDGVTPNVKEIADPNVISIVDENDPGNVNPNVEETVVNCAEGFVKSENGECVKSVSRLILSVPNQCPNGYRQDWLGNCRKMFIF